MKVHKLETVDAFVVVDLEGATSARGIVRAAPKVLVDGATWLARSQTYQFGVFERPLSGASAGINAKPDERAGAVARFVDEIRPQVERGELMLDAGKGIDPADLAPLREVDARGAAYEARAPVLDAWGVRAAAEAACGGSLDGRTVAIEGFDRNGPALAQALVAAGTRITAVSTASGTAVSSRGFDLDELTNGWQAHGADVTTTLADEVTSSAGVLGAPADVLFVGSKAGVVGHAEAAHVSARLVVPTGPVPVTAKALAVLSRREVEVLPDFVTTAGAMLATIPRSAGDAPESGGSGGAVATDPAGEIADLTRSLLDEADPTFLAACRRAEAFLSTWCDALPFGRPLA